MTDIHDDDELRDSDLTPAEAPAPKRRRSSQSMVAPVKCPACHGDPRHDCTFCINETTGINTRYVSPEKAATFDPKEHADTDPVPPTERQP